MSGTLLEVTELNAGYGDLPVLRSVDLTVSVGEIVALLGPNGAGKTTLLRVLAGVPLRTSGRRMLDGVDLSGLRPHEIAQKGVALVPEGRRLFSTMSVDDNLGMGAYTNRNKSSVKRARERVFELFPVLHGRRATLAGQLSGGEQQMLAVGRGLMASPRLLLLDEPSLGVSPKVLGEILHALKLAASDGLAVLLAEQQVGSAMEISNRVYVLQLGQVVIHDSSAVLRADPSIVEQAYFGQIDPLADRLP